MQLFPKFRKLILGGLSALFIIALLNSVIQAESAPIESVSADKIKNYWFDGAEITRYALTQSRYGREHSGSAELVFVTEPFLTEKQVKHEQGLGPSTPVLKVNAMRSFTTGIYPYQTMLSVFSPIDTQQWPHALKTTLGVQDWCGQVFHQINRRNNQWESQLFSYFQNPGDETLQLEDAWLEDEIWTRLRLDPQSLPQGKLDMIPGSLYLRFYHKPVAAYAAEASLIMGKKNEARYIVRYPELGRVLTIFFEKTFPYAIEGWEEKQAGESAVTVAKRTHRIERSYYWSLNAPEDKKHRQQLGLK